MSHEILRDFAARRAEAADILSALAQAAGQVGPETARFQAPLAQGAERLRQGRFVVLLVGGFSSGKSSLLNALLGQPVLPVKVNPCTAILTELRHGETASVEVHHGDRDPESLDPSAFIARYQLRTPTADQAELDRFASVERAIVRWPLPLLRDGVALIDTPGLDDDPARTERTLRSLPEADAVIFVLSATRFLSDLERSTLRRELLPLGLTNLFFPTTMADLLDALSQDPDQDRRDIEQRAVEILGPLCTIDGRARLQDRFFLLDARTALRARWTGEAPRDPVDDHALTTSGLPDFETALTRFLVEERGRAQLARGLDLAARALEGIERQAALDRATALASAEELRARHQALTPKLRALSQIAARVADAVDAFIDREADRTWHGLRDALSRAEAELPQALAELDLGPVAGLDLLTPGGRARVERAVHTGIESWLDERLQAWQRELQPRFERSLGELRDELAAEAHDFEALARAIVTDFTGTAVKVPITDLLGDEPDPLERWFAIALGAVLLSPATVAAGWSQGYEGALKGAASRLAVRVAVLAIGVLLGPIGWAGLVLYAISDAAVLVLTGGGQLRRLRRQVAENLQGRLVGQADEVRDELQGRVRESLRPIRDALVGAAQAEAAELSTALDELLVARERAVADAAERNRRYQATGAELRAGVDRLREIVTTLS